MICRSLNDLQMTMKKRIVSSFLFITFSLIYVSPSLFAQDPNQQMGDLLNNKDLFELDKQYPQLKSQVMPMLDYLAQSVLADAFNQPAQGHVALDSLLSNQTYQDQLGFGNICSLILLKAQLYEVEHNYTEAVTLLQSFLDQTAQAPLGDIRGNMQKALGIYQVLASHPPFDVKRPETDCTVAYTLEKAGRNQSILVPCAINGVEQKMIFDTGCPKYNYIDAQLAADLGLELLMDSIPMSGIGEGYGWLGMADSLQMGDITCYHPLFYVVDHSSFSDTPVSVEVVLGSYLLNHLGEFQLHPQQNTITFPHQLTPQPASGRNLVMQNRHLFFQVQHDGQHKVIHFDTGNVKSYLNQRFYTDHQDWVMREGLADTLKVGGFGGVSIQPAYQLPIMIFKMDAVAVEFKNLDVSTEPLGELWVEQGNFGVDFVQQYEKVVVNYKDMFIQLVR